jgi:hypothetical protein
MTRPAKPNIGNPFSLPDNEGFLLKKSRTVPHEFVLEALSSLSPWTRSMFGCLAIYVREKIVLILREKQGQPSDNGVWLATTVEHHESLRREFPSMRSIRVLGKSITGWQLLPTDAADFEESALRACELILAGDPRIGKVPGKRRASRGKIAEQSKSSTTARKSKQAAKLRPKK